MFPLYDENPTLRTPWITLAIIALNVFIFLGEFRLSPAKQQSLVFQHGFVPARLSQIESGEEIRIQTPQGQIHTLNTGVTNVALTMLSTMFLHGGWMHLLGNMWFLWIFGNNVEDRIGHFRFGIFYLLSGFGATLCHWFTGTESLIPVIGASGAIAGVLGAYAVTFPKAKVKTLVFLVVIITFIDLPALLVLGFWLLLQLLEASQSLHLNVDGGVAWWAHIGGFIIGAALIQLFKLGVPYPDGEATTFTNRRDPNISTSSWPPS
ncbi:Rhomboid domain containing peptidase [Planctomycetales bacterium 10988]|nr:Rhomboid domain containing peptidase [Planctomycetales bacterium 10988]